MSAQKILVAYATNAGSTVDVAHWVGEELGQQGMPVEVRPVQEVDTIEGYSAVVVGAPMIMGWHRSALNFLHRHQKALSRVPLACFVTAMSLTDQGEAARMDRSLSIDPWLARPPKKPGRLSFKERYATVNNYLKPILRAVRGHKPVSVAFFGGRMELFRLKWWQALFVMVVIQAPPGGSHNQAFIRAWAADIREMLK